MIEFWSKNRGLLAVILGLLSAFITVMLIESIGHYIYPPDELLDYSKPETIEKYLQSAPLGAMMFVVIAQVLASLVIGYVSTKVAPPDSHIPFYISMALFMIAIIANYVSLPHPIWMPISTIILALVAAYQGRMIAQKTYTLPNKQKQKI